MKKTDIPKNIGDQVYKDEDFTKTSFAGHTFYNCTFENCNFTEASFEQANLMQCTFIRCNLSNTILRECQMEQILFKETKLVGLDFSVCDTALLFSINAEESFFDYCNFSSLELNGASFKKSEIHSSQFIDSRLQQANFTETDLAKTLFHHCDLREANFTGAINYMLNPCENKLARAIFSFPECIGLLKALDITIIQ